MMVATENHWFPDPGRMRRLLKVGMLQQNERSCSVASIAMLVNSARCLWPLAALDEPISQQRLLDQVGNANWKSAVGPGGDGIELNDLAGLARQSLCAYGFSNLEIDVVHVDRVTPGARAKARRMLNETVFSPACFMIANFLQGIYTEDSAGSVGHYAPVAAFDPLTRRALILDPDPRGYRPYWVSEERFLEGMATLDESCGLSRGYLSIRIEPASPQTAQRKALP
jgi:hypothetical protein